MSKKFVPDITRPFLDDIKENEERVYELLDEADRGDEGASMVAHMFITNLGQSKTAFLNDNAGILTEDERNTLITATDDAIKRIQDRMDKRQLAQSLSDMEKAVKSMEEASIDKNGPIITINLGDGEEIL